VVVAGAGVEGVVISAVALFVVGCRLFAAFLVVADFFAEVFRPDAFFAAFFVVFFVVFRAPDVFAAALADFLVDFLAPTRRDRALVPLFFALFPALFLEPLAALLRAPFAFLLPFLVAMFGSSSFVPLISQTVTKYHCDVHGLSKRLA
jgi:hypothetical protein